MKALLIDDHPLILSALEAVIQGLDTAVSVVPASSARAAREALCGHGPFDLALLDLQLNDADGFELLAELRAAHPDMPIVVVSASERSTDVLRAIDLGAMGFVPKCASNETLFEALSLVLSGGIYVPPMIMRRHDASHAAASPLPSVPPPVWAARLAPSDRAGSGVRAPYAVLGLTPRQTEVLNLLLKGQPNKLIARELKLSVETVKDHVAAVLRTLNVSSRTQAVLAVSQMTTGGGWREPLARPPGYGPRHDARHG